MITAKNATAKTVGQKLLLEKKALAILCERIDEEINYAISCGKYEAVVYISNMIAQDHLDKELIVLENCGYKVICHRRDANNDSERWAISWYP
jgi:hypothetical protein